MSKSNNIICKKNGINVAVNKEWTVSSNDNFIQEQLVCIQILMVSVGTLHSTTFKELLDKYKPALALETRKVPEFLGVYDNLKSAYSDFEIRGIKYVQTPIKHRGKLEEIWMDVGKFINQIVSQSKSHPESPIIVFMRTEYHLNRIDGLVKKLVLSELPNAKFEYSS